MSRAWLLPPHYRKNSLFTTTFRNVLSYWCCNIFIFTAYFVCWYQIISAVPDNSLVWQSVHVILWFVISIPVWGSVFAPRHYHNHEWLRGWVAIFSVVIIAFWLFAEQTLFHERAVTAGIFFSWLFIFFYVVSPRQVKVYIRRLLLTTLILFLIDLLLEQYLLIIFQSVTSIVVEIFDIISLPTHNFLSPNPQFSIYTGLIALGILLLISNPAKFLRKHFSYWMYIFRPVRYDVIQARYSPVVGLVNWVNKLRYNILPGLIDHNNRGLYIISLMTLGIVVSFIDLNFDDSTITFFDLKDLKVAINDRDIGLTFLNGIGLGIVFTSLYLLYYSFSKRSRYIISEFTINDFNGKEHKSPELQAVATLTTSLLTDEMQRIAVLLRMRQIENVYFSPDDNNAFFVTTGTDEQFINQVQQIVSIDVPQGRFNPGALWAVMARALADIHIEGKVQRRTNGNIEIWVHMSYGSNGSLAIEQSIVPENNIIEVDEHSLRPVIRMIATKLFIEMGQVTHLSSTVESFDDLLRGLEASANRDWWRAISYYRRTLNAEETLRGLYGLGHYQLGAALTFQGDWQQGLEHLHTAELDGPLMPEIRYMLAFSLLYLYWDRLDKRRNVFNQIETHLHAAMTMRPDFAEAYQLLGTAFYRRGRQIEVSRTRHKTEEEKKKDPQYTEAQQKYNYREAARCLGEAIKLYDKRERLQVDVPNLYANTQNSNESPLHQRITATHQLGDALRGLGRYLEAETYYQTVHAIYPRNLRNLNDLSKTLCLSENWQRAEEFLWRDVFIHDVAWWDADSSLHMAWAMFGGILDTNRKKANSFTLLHTSAKKWYNYETADEEFLAKYPIFQYSEALKYLDFALHQRPRYITSWKQTNWTEPFVDGARYFQLTDDSNFPRYLRDQLSNLARVSGQIIVKGAKHILSFIPFVDIQNHEKIYWQELNINVDQIIKEQMMVRLLDVEEQKTEKREAKAQIKQLRTFLRRKSGEQDKFLLDAYITAQRFLPNYIIDSALNYILDLESNPLTEHENDIVAKFQEAKENLVKAEQDLKQAKKDLSTAKSQQNSLDNEDIHRLAQRNLLWIMLRIDSYDLPTDYSNANRVKPHSVLGELEQFKEWQPAVRKAIKAMDEEGKFGEHHRKLQQNRQHVLIYVKIFEDSPRSTGLVWQYARLSLAQMLFKDWCAMQVPFKQLCDAIQNGITQIENSPDKKGKHSDGPTFRQRWELEIYAETTMLTARMLAEAECYELLLLVTLQACDVFEKWSKWWQGCFPSHHQDSSMAYRHLTFSPRLTRYHHASVQAWKAYALHQCVFDRVDSARVLSLKLRESMLPYDNKNDGVVNQLYSDTRNYITKFFMNYQSDDSKRGDNKAQQSLNEQGDKQDNDSNSDEQKLCADDIKIEKFDRDRVLNAMQAQIRDARKHIHEHPLSMYVQALIHQRREVYPQAIEEYERLIDLVAPYDPKRQIGMENLPKGDYETDEPLAESSLRSRMYYMEQVSGRQQFYGIVSLPHIHEQIAACYFMTYNPELRVKHLLEAIRQSPNSDADIDNFLRMALQLNMMEQYDEALSILEAVRSPLKRLGDAKLSQSLYQKSDVLNATVRTRAKDYAGSMNYCRDTAGNLDLRVKLPNKSMLQAQKIVWEYVAQLQKPEQDIDQKQLDKLINQFHENLEAVLKCLDGCESVLQDSAEYAKTIDEVKQVLFKALSGMDSNNEEQEPNSEAQASNANARDFLKGVIDKVLGSNSSKLHNNSQAEKKDIPDALDSLETICTKFLNESWVRLPPPETSNVEDILAIFSKNLKDRTGGKQGKEFDWDLLNKASIRARVVLNPKDRQQFFEQLTSKSTEKLDLEPQFGIIMSMHMAMFISREYSNKLSQFSELCNTLAYNRAQTGLRLDHAYNDSAVAISVMFYLLHSAPRRTLMRMSFERKLAQFLDTFGWVRYRHFHAQVVGIKDFSELIPQFRNMNEPIQKTFGFPNYNIDRLKIAEEFLQRGLRYDRERAIIHYHLARLYLTRVEALWQGFPELQDEDIHGLAPLIDTSITQSFRYLRNARQFDRFNRLHSQLSWLNNRLQMYKIAWEKRQFRGIAGDIKAGSPFFEQGGVFSGTE